METVFGYQIIRIDAFSPARVQTLEEARPALTETLRQRAARKAAVNRLEDLLDASQARATSDLKALAGTMGLTSRTSDFFTAENPPAFLGGLKAEAEKAVSQPVGLISDPVDARDVLSVYVPLERRDSFIPELDDPRTKEAVKKAWIDAESFKKAREAAEALIKDAKENGSFVQAARALSSGSPELGSTPIVARREILAAPEPVSLSDFSLLLKAAFSLSRPGETAPEPIHVESPEKRGFLALSLRDYKPADDAQFQKSAEEWRSSLLES